MLTVNLETEAEPEHKLTPELRRTITKTNLFLELIFKILLMELQKPRHLVAASLVGLDRTLFQTLATPTMFLRYVVSLFAGKPLVQLMGLHFSLFY